MFSKTRVRLVVLFSLIAALFAVSAKFVVDAQRTSKSRVTAPTVSAVSATETITDTAGTVDGNADPNHTLTFTVLATNNDSSAATGVTMGTTLPSIVTQANSGIVGISPVAGNDAFAATGNFTVTANAANGLLTNDYMGANPAGTLTAFDATSLQGGTVVVNADGSYTYTPPANFVGTDTFTYTLSNSVASSVGTVTVTVADRVLFVSAAGSGTNCRAATPCTLATADAIAAPGGTNKDLVYVLSGTYSSAAFTMNAGQVIAGQGVNFNQALQIGRAHV